MKLLASVILSSIVAVFVRSPRHAHNITLRLVRV
jgi:hypothetical protein